MICDSATRFGRAYAGAVVVCGSHGGVYPGYLAARSRVRAVVFSDAGVGKDRAGLGSLGYGEQLGMAVATAAHDSARIGDAADILTRGRISHANRPAQLLGVVPAMPVADALERLADAADWRAEPPAYVEARAVVRDEPGRPRVVCLDSVSLVGPEDVGQIVLTGSHGGLLGGEPAAALKVDALAALFNDAGIGIDDAGIGRLAALDQRRIAAATVDAMSARIGEGRSTWQDGVLSRVNAAAGAKGAAAGMPARAFAELF